MVKGSICTKMDELLSTGGRVGILWGWNGFRWNRQSNFLLSFESNLRLLWFYITTLSDWLKKNSRHFLNQSEVKPKQIKSKTKTNLDLYDWFEFWLDNGLLCVLCYWPENYFFFSTLNWNLLYPIDKTAPRRVKSAPGAIKLNRHFVAETDLLN